MRWDARRSSLSLLATFALALSACGGANDFPEATSTGTATPTPIPTPTSTPTSTPPPAETTPPPTQTAPVPAPAPPPAANTGGGGNHNNNNDDDDDGGDHKPHRPNRPHRSLGALPAPPPSAQIVWDTHGQAVALWRVFDGTRNDLWADRYNGVSWTGARLLEASAGDVGNAHIALDATGNAIAAWEQQTDGSRAMWAARFDIARGWQAPTVVSRSPDGLRIDAFAPQVSANADGSMRVRWQQIDGQLALFGTTASFSRRWENRFTPGLGWSGATLITTS